jgi:Rps23 Pro-64 3,4-dihydroxylase Tpa1-like proline 4-hydroxylase
MEKAGRCFALVVPQKSGVVGIQPDNRLIPLKNNRCMMTLIKPIDQNALRERVRQAKPFPFFCIDGFLDDAFAEQVHGSFPSYEEAAQIGRKFSAVNERGKIQVTDSTKFAAPVAELNRALAAPEFLEKLSHIFAIPNLLADDELVGGGIHQTGPRGHLDVHVDFNYIQERQLHRRLNILIYFNKDWEPEWGGNIELWDKDVKVCHHSFTPIFNRCVVFETNEISYHGVTAVTCPEDRARKSFAAYYYTKEAPAHWDGEAHSTNFKARPDERLKGNVLMPLEKASRRLRETVAGIKRKIRNR